MSTMLCAGFGTLYVHLNLPETKGLSLTEVQAKLQGKPLQLDDRGPGPGDMQGEALALREKRMAKLTCNLKAWVNNIVALQTKGRSVQVEKGRLKQGAASAPG